MAPSKKDLLDAAAESWQEPAPDFSTIAEVFGTPPIPPPVGPEVDLDEIALQAEGFLFSRAHWETAPSDRQRLARNAMVVRQLIASATSDMMASADKALGARAATLLGKLVDVAVAEDRSFVGYSYNSMRENRVEWAAEAAEAIRNLLVDAKARLAKEHPGESNGLVLKGLAASVRRALPSSNRSRGQERLKLDPLEALGRSSPRSIAVTLAARAWGVDESEVRSGTPRIRGYSKRKRPA